jgi:membrane protease YdiL (CAAX protease family)
MNFRKIFINPFGRLRSGWRFTFFLCSFIILGAFFGGLAKLLLLQMPFDSSKGSLLFILTNSLVSLSGAILLGWLFGKLLEDLPFRALGAQPTKNGLKDFGLGLLLGTLSLGSAASLAAGFGGLSFNFNSSFGSTAILLTMSVSFVVFAVAAAFEEALFRGYILQTFTRAKLGWLAIIVTSVFFALVHLDNSGANYISSFNTALAGVWFGVAYLKTRNLWFPFGLHLAWNWMQGAIFGIEVSGLKNLTTAPLFRETDAGPNWLTGGDYGIEGGIACTIALVFSTALIYFLPVLKPTEEMLALTNQENPKGENLA